ncbi:heterokaryon incompatibility protein-domain-containing protein [Poronia punctata]|nr:heterokaryon incompatibility protein-domain-containing protein [Poronia punctata]
MRLLNTKTLELKYFAQSPEEAYAILSHTWGEDEVLFSDAENLSSGLWNSWSLAKTLSAEKIRAAAALAASRRFRYIWVDTCCIDKSSSTELSEAVNSMFKWYQAARICFAYLSDVNPPEESQTKGVSFQNARWFSRGWTELIAPPEVEFYDAEWKLLGDRSSLVDVIHHTTKVHRNLLRPVRPRDWYSWYPSGPVVDEYPVSEIFIWAKSRETTRGEDIAYCLMGLFGVNMPLLYGEGKENALLRLQRNIISSCNDHSILLHADSAPLAKSLSEFNYKCSKEVRGTLGHSDRQFLLLLLCNANRVQ